MAVLNNLDATKNRFVKVHDAVITQNKIIEVAKKVNGEPGNVEETTTDAVREWAYATLKGGKKKEIRPAQMGFLRSGMFAGDEYGSDFTKTGVDNELLRIPVMTDEEVEEIIKRYV